MFQNKFANFKNPIVLHIVIFNINATSEIIVRILTGLKYFNHHWLWRSKKSIIKDRGVNLYVNESKCSINSVAFPTNICFQMYLLTDHFEIKNTSLNKQMLCDAPWCSAVVRSLSWCSGMIRCALGVIRCSVSAPSAIRCSVAPGPLVSVLLDAWYKQV